MDGSELESPEQERDSHRRTNISSGYLGVSLRGSVDDRTWWKAGICVHRKRTLIGCSYASKEAAARVRDRALIAYLGRDLWGTRKPRYNFPIESYPEETEYQRKGADLLAFLRELKADVNPEGVPAIPHVTGWVPPNVMSLKERRKSLRQSRHQRCEACIACKQVGSRPPCLNPTEREPANSEEEGAQPTIADNEGMHSDGKWLPPNVVINNRSKRQRAEAALKPKAAPEPVETLRGLGSMKYIRRREAEMSAIYFGTEKSVAENAEPLCLLRQPSLQPMVRDVRIDYEAELRRIRICAERGELVTLKDFSAELIREALDSSRPQEAAAGWGAWAKQAAKASEAAGISEKAQEECRLCRHREHSTASCLVMAAAMGVAGASIAQRGAKRRQRNVVDAPQWLERVPERTQGIMVAIKNLAALHCARGNGLRNKHLRKFSPEALLALALLAEEVMDASLHPREYASRLERDATGTAAEGDAEGEAEAEAEVEAESEASL